MEATIQRTPSGVAIDTTISTTESNGVEISVKRSVIGWGGVVKSRNSKPYAVFVAGSLLRNDKGTVKTFATREAARVAGEKVTIGGK